MHLTKWFVLNVLSLTFTSTVLVRHFWWRHHDQLILDCITIDRSVCYIHEWIIFLSVLIFEHWRIIEFLKSTYINNRTLIFTFSRLSVLGALFLCVIAYVILETNIFLSLFYFGFLYSLRSSRCINGISLHWYWWLRSNSLFWLWCC